MSYPTQIGKTGQTIEFQCFPVDDETPPQAAPLDGAVPISFTVDDPTVAAAAMENNATLKAHISLLKPGSTLVHVNATSDGVPLTEPIPVQVTARNAVTFGIVFQPPV